MWKAFLGASAVGAAGASVAEIDGYTLTLGEANYMTCDEACGAIDGFECSESTMYAASYLTTSSTIESTVEALGSTCASVKSAKTWSSAPQSNDGACYPSTDDRDESSFSCDQAAGNAAAMRVCACSAIGDPVAVIDGFTLTLGESGYATCDDACGLLDGMACSESAMAAASYLTEADTIESTVEALGSSCTKVKSAKTWSSVPRSDGGKCYPSEDDRDESSFSCSAASSDEVSQRVCACVLAPTAAPTTPPETEMPTDAEAYVDPSESPLTVETVRVDATTANAVRGAGRENGRFQRGWSRSDSRRETHLGSPREMIARAKNERKTTELRPF